MTQGSPSTKRIRLFRSPGLERLTVVSVPAFLMLWSVGLPLIAWAAFDTASTPLAIALAASGILAWSLTEYSLHRFVFHWQPRWPPLANLVFIMHGNHHADPNDPLRNLMPPIASVPIGALFWLAAWLFLGPAGSWFFLGFMVGYVAYDLIHYACHQRPMKGRLARMFKQNHMRHHHGRKNGNYAITAMIWDRVFGTRITSINT